MSPEGVLHTSPGEAHRRVRLDVEIVIGPAYALDLNPLAPVEAGSEETEKKAGDEPTRVSGPLQNAQPQLGSLSITRNYYVNISRIAREIQVLVR